MLTFVVYEKVSCKPCHIVKRRELPGLPFTLIMTLFSASYSYGQHPKTKLMIEERKLTFIASWRLSSNSKENLCRKVSRNRIIERSNKGRVYKHWSFYQTSMLIKHVRGLGFKFRFKQRMDFFYHCIGSGDASMKTDLKEALVIRRPRSFVRASAGAYGTSNWVSRRRQTIIYWIHRLEVH